MHPTRKGTSNTRTKGKDYLRSIINVSKPVLRVGTLTILHSLNYHPDAGIPSVGSARQDALGYLGLDAPTDGDIRIDGESIVAMTDDVVGCAQKIGLVFQSFQLIPS